MKRIIIPLLTLATLILATSALHAAPKEEGADKPKKTPAPISVAVLDFETTTPGDPDMGKNLSALLNQSLTDLDGFTLVDRATFAQTLKENSIGLTGLVTAEQSTRIGRVVGVKILITGRVFLIDKQLFFSAKLIGTETSLLASATVTGDKDANTGEMMLKFSEKVAAKLREAGPRLIARDDPVEDPLPALKKALAGRKLPTVAVQIKEHHIGAAPDARIDPAVETEIALVLKDAGFTIINGNEKDQLEGGVAVIIGGEAFSEFATRIGNLVSCSARVEIKMTDRKTSELLFSDRETTRGVDLAENLAAKNALQKAGHILAIRILRHFDETLGAEKAGGEKKVAPEEKKVNGEK